MAEYVEEIILILELPKTSFSPLSLFLPEVKAIIGPNNGALLKILNGKEFSFEALFSSLLLFWSWDDPSILAIKCTTSIFSILLSVISLESSSKWPRKISLCFSNGIS